ncbi:MAG: DUF1294 domain-containing protein [Tyzzerella sp.]|nr:DUF1294 domain-containing protein [Tyzzerella sp.]
MEVLIIYGTLVNVIAFFLYGIDKWKARKDLRRIPERVLLEIAVIGGSVGAYVGMHLFRHKTRKVKFSVGVPIIFFIQIGILLYIYH